MTRRTRPLRSWPVRSRAHWGPYAPAREQSPKRACDATHESGTSVEPGWHWHSYCSGVRDARRTRSRRGNSSSSRAMAASVSITDRATAVTVPLRSTSTTARSRTRSASKRSTTGTMSCCMRGPPSSASTIPLRTRPRRPAPPRPRRPRSTRSSCRLPRERCNTTLPTKFSHSTATASSLRAAVPVVTRQR